MKTLNLESIKNTALTIALGIMLAAGITYAWSANWHDPATWVSDGSVIQADKLGESLQYLYDENEARKQEIANLSNMVGVDGADGASAPMYADCDAQSVSWSNSYGNASCSGSVPASAHSISRGVSYSYTSPNPWTYGYEDLSYSGSAVFQCNDGSWNMISGSCTRSF